MSSSTDNWARIARGCAEIISEADLRDRLAKGRPLRIKLGVDPTAPDLHFGHLVALRKLRTFQELGHQVVFIIGDYTAQIGDPSGRSQLRPQMEPDQVERNAETYLAQVFRVLDPARTEVRRNADWLLRLKSPLELASVMNLLFTRATVQRLMERDDFAKRQKAGQPVYLSEMAYPLFQGYDSVVVKADVEIGGTDQLFNLLMGRDLQRDFGQAPQVVMTLPLLEGTDGVRKMSKSYGNYIAFNDSAQDQFGKIMSIPDALMPKYAELLTDLDRAELAALHPRQAKALLGRTLVAQFHGSEAAEAAAQGFDRVFSQREAPENVPEFRIPAGPCRLTDLLVSAGLAPSKNEARRLLLQGAVEVDGRRVSEKDVLNLAQPALIQVGKRRFVQIIPS